MAENQYFQTEPKTPSAEEYFDFTEAVNKAKAGDPEGFETLYFKSIPLLEREARKYCKTQADLEDALQDIYLRIYEKLDTLKDPKKFMGWALVLTKNALLNEKGKRERQEGLDDPTPNVSDEETPGLDLLSAEEYRTDINPDAHISQNHVVETVRTVLESLPENQQLCLLYWMQGYSHPQIAEELGMPLGTVKSNLNYGKKKVSQILRAMEREGTFDYHEVATSPEGAFLELLERYFANPGAVSAEAEGLFPKVQSVLPVGDVLPPAPVSALKKVLSKPSTAVTSVLLVLVVAIGVALGIQQLSTDVPVAPQNPVTTRVTRTRAEETSASTTAPSDEGTGTRENPAPAANPVTVSAPVPAANAANANAGNTNATTIAERTTANAGNEGGPLVAEEVDESGSTLANIEEQLVDLVNTTGDRNDVRVASSSTLGSFDEHGFSDILLLTNMSQKTVSVSKIVDYTLKDAITGKILYQNDIIPSSPKKMAPEETIWLKITIPLESLPSDTRSQFILKKKWVESTSEVVYKEINEGMSN